MSFAPDTSHEFIPRHIGPGAADQARMLERIGAPTLDALMEEVETLLAASNLPEQADTAYWDRFLCETLERELFK